MSAKSLLVFVAVFQILGAAKQAGSEVKICQGIRAGGSNSAFRCLRPRFLVGRIKREKKIRTGNHIRRRLHKIWLNIVNKRKSKKQIKERKKVSKMKMNNNERRQGKYILASEKHKQRVGTRHKKLGKRKKEKLQRKWKRKKYDQRRQKQKLSKMIHIHIRQPGRMRMFRPKRRIKTKQRGKSQRGAVKLFLEK